MKTRILVITSILVAAAVCPIPIQAKSKGGDGAEAHRRKGVELVDAKQYPQAIDEFNKEVEASPGNPEAYRDRGTAYRAAGRAAEAAGDWTTASARYQSALADFSKEIELAPKDASGYVERAQTEVLARQFEPGVADASKALESKPDDALALKFRGFGYIGLSQWDKAVADFNAALQKDPNDPQSYDRRAWANRNLRNYPAAVEDYTTLLQKDDGEARRYLCGDGRVGESDRGLPSRVANQGGRLRHGATAEVRAGAISGQERTPANANSDTGDEHFYAGTDFHSHCHPGHYRGRGAIFDPG
jgi:tetratricopeptide (TPR) repeat protein